MPPLRMERAVLIKEQQASLQDNPDLQRLSNIRDILPPGTFRRQTRPLLARLFVRERSLLLEAQFAPPFLRWPYRRVRPMHYRLVARERSLRPPHESRPGSSGGAPTLPHHFSRPYGSRPTLTTRRLRQALAIVDIRVLDHFIIAGPDAISVVERGCCDTL